MLLIARRYLLSTKSHSVVNIIAGVSLVALFIPVAAVIVLLSIFNGFGRMVEDLSGAVDGDLTVRLYEGRLFEMSEIEAERLRSIEGVEGLSFVTDHTMLVEYEGRSSVVTVRGVDGEYLSVIPIEPFVSVGKFDVADDRIVMGNSLASKLGIRAVNNARIKLYAPRQGVLQSFVSTSNYTMAEVELAAVLWLDQESEQRYIFVSQELVNRVTGREEMATRVSIKLTDREDIERVKREIQAVVGDRFRVESLAELNPTIYQIVRYEKRSILLICSFVILLASFTLIGALTMLILEKRGDVSTLKAMGMTQKAIRRTFLMEGAIISGVAIVMGVVVGVAVTLAQQHFGIVELPTSSMLVSVYPVELKVGDVVGTVAIAGAISMVLCWMVVCNMLTKDDI